MINATKEKMGGAVETLTELKLSKMITGDRVVDLISSKRENVLKELIQVMSTTKAVSNKLDFYKAITEREALGNTGVGLGVALPHAMAPGISEMVIAIGRKPEGIAYEAADGVPVQIVVMIGAPENRTDDFLKVLSKIILLFRNSKFRKRVLDVRTSNDVVHLFKDK